VAPPSGSGVCRRARAIGAEAHHALLTRAKLGIPLAHSWPCGGFLAWLWLRARLDIERSLQLTAFFTSALIVASAAAVSSLSAKAVGHMAP